MRYRLFGNGTLISQLYWEGDVEVYAECDIGLKRRIWERSRLRENLWNFRSQYSLPIVLDLKLFVR